MRYITNMENNQIGKQQNNPKEIGKYTPVCTRNEIGSVFYPNAQVPANSVTATYSNSTCEVKKKKYKAMDIGTWGIVNNVNPEDLKYIDGETLSMLIQIVKHMQEKICDKASPEIMQKFEEFLKFQEISEQMKKK